MRWRLIFRPECVLVQRKRLAKKRNTLGVCARGSQWVRQEEEGGGRDGEEVEEEEQESGSAAPHAFIPPRAQLARGRGRNG